MKTLRYLDTCYPDYFQGTSEPIVIGLHHRGQTVKQVIESVMSCVENEVYEDYIYEAIDHYMSTLTRKQLNEVAIDESYLDDEYGTDDSETMVHYFMVVDV